MNTVERLALVKKHSEFFREAIRGESKNKNGAASYKGPDLTFFDEEAWFTSAYYTFQRTLWGVFSPLTDDQKKRAREFVFQQLPRIESDPAEFKKAWSALLQGLIALSKQPDGSHGISLGHAQKLVSMIVKYAYVADKLDGSDLDDGIRSMVQDCRQLLPVPLDNIVLKCLVVKKELEFWRISCTQKGSPWINQAKPTDNEDCWVRWSRLQNLDAYWDIQDLIRNEARGDPMGYELVELWSRSP